MNVKDQQVIALDFGSRRIGYNVRRSAGRRVRIVVSPDLAVNVFRPRFVSLRRLEEMVRAKAPWIARSLDKMAEFHPLPAPKQFISGETFLLLGRQYRLRVVEGPRAPAKLDETFLVVSIRDRTSTPLVKRAIDKWYEAEARKVFGEHVDKWLAVAASRAAASPVVTIRRMRTRWGSCSAKGRISLNLNLVQAPVQCVEYVIVHELCHLKHHNHSKAFYSLLARCLPDWRKRKELLHKISLPGRCEMADGASPSMHGRAGMLPAGMGNGAQNARPPGNDSELGRAGMMPAGKRNGAQNARPPKEAGMEDGTEAELNTHC